MSNVSFKVGQTMTVTGMPHANAAQFKIDVGNGKNIALHVNPRFSAHRDTRTIVCNSYNRGTWGQEIREGGFPFHCGVDFKITITFTKQQFTVTLPNGSVILFPNRHGCSECTSVHCHGDVSIHSMEIK